jgi:hypothetical protein
MASIRFISLATAFSFLFFFCLLRARLQVTTTGLVTASAYSSTKNVVYMGEVTKSGSFLITVDVATGKQSKVNLGGVTVIDMATGY